MMEPVGIGMVGAGRATQLHMHALEWVHDVPVSRLGIAAATIDEARQAKERYGFAYAAARLDELLDDPKVHVIDICTPPAQHADMILRALEAGKHVICEKPLTGYFGLPGDMAPIGDTVPREAMRQALHRTLRTLREALRLSGKQFMYAENFVYAPAITRAAEMIRLRKSKILFLKGEESVNGSSSPVAGQWAASGGGACMRLGVHPLAAALWLKRQEAQARGEHIHVSAVMADMGRAAQPLSGLERRHLFSPPGDVEDQGTILLTFSDNTRAVIMASDTRLGGSRNCIELYCNDAVIDCTLTLSDLMRTYLPDEAGLDGYALSELLPAKTGWNMPSVADEVIRGYVHEMQDFMEAVYQAKEPRAGFDLAMETVDTLYAAYQSAETGRRVEMPAACLSF